MKLNSKCLLKLTIYCLSLLGTNIYTNCQHFYLRSLKGLAGAPPPPYRPCWRRCCWCGCWCWWRRRSRWWRSPSRAGSPSPPPPLSLGFSSPPFHSDSWGAWAVSISSWRLLKESAGEKSPSKSDNPTIANFKGWQLRLVKHLKWPSLEVTFQRPILYYYSESPLVGDHPWTFERDLQTNTIVRTVTSGRWPSLEETLELAVFPRQMRPNSAPLSLTDIK